MGINTFLLVSNSQGHTNVRGVDFELCWFLPSLFPASDPGIVTDIFNVKTYTPPGTLSLLFANPNTLMSELLQVLVSLFAPSGSINALSQ